MVAVAMLLGWGGYAAGLWGWCLLRDYNVTFTQLVSPVKPYSGPWPPAKIPGSQTWPGKTTAAQAVSQLGAAPAAGPAATATVPVGNATGSFPTVQPGGQITPGTGTSLA